MTEWFYEKKILDLGSFSFLLHTYLYGVMDERNREKKGTRSPKGSSGTRLMYIYACLLKV